MTDSISHKDRMTQAEQAFSEGNYAKVRELLTPAVETKDEAEKEAAMKMLARVSPSPIGKYLFLLTAVLLVSVTYFAYAQ